MRNYDRLHPIRRCRIPGDFPLWETPARNDSRAEVILPTDQLAAEPANLPVNQSDTRPIPLGGQVDDPQANSPDQVGAISRGGDAKRPPDAGPSVATDVMKIPGHGLAGDGSAMPVSSHNEAPTIPANGPDGVPPDQPDRVMAEAPSATPIPSESTGEKVTRIPFRQQVEGWFKQEQLPYIRVDEAKRALFAGARLRSFHFVVYMGNTGPHWLLWAGPLNRECRKDMQQWESIFGDGFMAVIARTSQSNARGFSLQTLAGQTVAWPIQEAESQPNSHPKSPP
jgi:hypothetical protein